MALPALVLVNPVAAGGRAAALWRRVEPVIRSRLPGAIMRWTERPGLPGAAAFQAREWAAGHPEGLLVLLGGDGTVHEAVDGLIAGGGSNRLAIIPSGTGNDFARSAGIPSSVESALEALDRGATRAVDVGRLGFRSGGEARDCCFINSVSVGVTPPANRLAASFRRVLPGRLSYAAGGAAALLVTRPRELTVTAGATLVFSGAALNLTVANAPSFGGGIRISPGSRLDDGVLDLVSIGPLGLARGLLALARAYRGNHLRMRGIRATPLSGPVRIRAAAGPLPLEADGQNYESDGELTIELLPGRLRLAV